MIGDPKITSRANRKQISGGHYFVYALNQYNQVKYTFIMT